MSCDARSSAERRRDRAEASLTTADRILRHERLIARATAAGLSRPDLHDELAALKRKHA